MEKKPENTSGSEQAAAKKFDWAHVKTWLFEHCVMPFRRAGWKKSVLFSIVFVFFAFYAFTILYPFFWMVLNSFKDPVVFGLDKLGLNFDAGFSNYVNAFQYKVKGTSVAMMYLNSFLVVGGGVLATLISCSLASYTVAKYKFRGRGIIYNVVIVAMLVPIVGTLPAQYRLMQNLHLIDNIVGVWFLYSGGFGFNFLFLYAYFKGISWTYAEAAQLDGASDFRIFIQIMIPMAKPALTAIGVLTFMGLWGDYQTPYFYLNSMPTIALGLKDISDQMAYEPNYPLLLATAVVATVPIILLFCVFQKTIMNNLTMGGLKG
jgi:raffinose/stachyose/melibiose transport system permease protein/N-acetylglucosamine transport system permease protein